MTGRRGVGGLFPSCRAPQIRHCGGPPGRYPDPRPIPRTDLFLHEESRGVDKVICHLRHLPKKHPRSKAKRKALKYFHNHGNRMNYAGALAANLPFVSGVVETVRKTPVMPRLNRSGMSSGIDGGHAILTFRSLAKSNRLNATRQLLPKIYKKDVLSPENVVQLPKRLHS